MKRLWLLTVSLISLLVALSELAVTGGQTLGRQSETFKLSRRFSKSIEEIFLPSDDDLKKAL